MSETAHAEAAAVVDVRGRFCPEPVIETAKAVKQVEVGEVVRILGTDPGMQSDLPAWCKATGHELLGLERDGDVIDARIRRRK